MWRFVCYIFDFLKVQNPLFKGLFTSLMAEIAHSGIFILSVSAHILAKNETEKQLTETPKKPKSVKQRASIKKRKKKVSKHSKSVSKRSKTAKSVKRKTRRTR